MRMNTVETRRAQAPIITRVRQEPKIRSLVVDHVEQVTPKMLRITLTGADLADFNSPGFDDHVKLIVPGVAGAMERRDYTPRRYGDNILVLDFAVHEAGPATRWALAAKAGDTLQVAGPNGSTIVSPDVRRWFLIGDETALPAIGRRIEEAQEDTQITAVVAVGDGSEEQRFTTRAALTMIWAHRPPVASGDPTTLLHAVARVTLEIETFVWIAAEAAVARAMRDHVLTAKSHPKAWLKAGGYWIKGQADGRERIE
jgi:NADPH-dependent ferric siderophore reductase